MQVTMRQISRDQGEFTVSELDYYNEYFSCCSGDTVFLYFQMQTHEDMPDIAVFHFTHKAWSHSVLKNIRLCLNQFVSPMLKSRGIDKIVGLTNGNVNNWAKLMYAMGFIPKQLPDGRQIVVAEV